MIFKKRYWNMADNEFDKWINDRKGMFRDEIEKIIDKNLVLTIKQADEYMKLLREAPVRFKGSEKNE